MKKWVKITLGVIGGIILLFVIDLICIFTINRPLLAIKEDNGDSVNFVYRGLLYDTLYCHEYSTPQIKPKGTKISCAVERVDIGKVIKFEDKTKNIEDFACDTALEKFYEDANYTYYWNCMKNEYMIVKYENEFEETISNALKYGTITINDLDRYNIDYIKENKNQEELQTPPDIFVYIDENEKAKALLGTYSWKITKDGIEEVITADSKHPSQIKYDDINTLKLNATKVNIESNNATISSANIYNIDKTESIKKISWDNSTIMLGNLNAGEYVLEIVASYSQGKVYYGVKLVVE